MDYGLLKSLVDISQALIASGNSPALEISCSSVIIPSEEPIMVMPDLAERELAGLIGLLF
jgi:hypothetical protein